VSVSAVTDKRDVVTDRPVTTHGERLCTCKLDPPPGAYHHVAIHRGAMNRDVPSTTGAGCFPAFAGIDDAPRHRDHSRGA
jgi:hypothetical protein